MRLVVAFLVAVLPAAVGQAYSLHVLFVLLVVGVGISSALLIVVEQTLNRRAFMLLIATFTAGIAVSPPVLGIGSHHPIGTGSLLAQSLLWMPTLIAILVASPDAGLVGLRSPQRWLFLVGLIGLLLSPLTAEPVTTVAATVSLLAVLFIATAAQSRLGAPDSLRAMALGIGAFVGVSMASAYPSSHWNWAIGEVEQTSWGVTRLAGLAAEPMHLSLLGGLGAILAISTLHRAETSMRYCLIVAAVISTTGALWGQGRMPLIALAGACLWFLLRAGSNHARVALLSFAAAALVVLVVAGPGDLLRRDGSNENLSSLNGRDAIWPVALDAIQEQPLVGYGAAGSEQVFTEAIENGSLRSAAVRNAHNRGLEILIMFGLVGLTLTTIAIGSSLSGFTRGGAPEAEAVLLYLLISGLTTPGSGSAFVDPLVMAFVVALVGLATNSSDYRTLRPAQKQSEGPALPSQFVRP